jgi:hypothetical protein
MKGRALVLSLLVYLSLDLANPLMPGAVAFVDGSLRVVDAGRPVAVDLPAPAVSLEACHYWVVEPAPIRQLPCPTAGARGHRWRIPFPRMRPVTPEAPPASEDH